MRGRDIGRLVAPNRPGSKRELTNEQSEPQDRQSPERSQAACIPPRAKAKCNHRNRNQKGKKAVRHLQPDLEAVNIGQSPCIAPNIDFYHPTSPRVWDPSALSVS